MRVEISDIEKLLKPSGIETIVFPAANTILDIEEVTRSETYKNPKSSRDIEAIMREYLDEGPEGYTVRKPLPNPVEVRSDSRALHTLAGQAGISDYHIEMNEVRRRASEIGGHGYFPGGESEALRRLRCKVIEVPDYVNEFSKPDTFSTNENQNPLEPTTTGLSPYISTGCLSVRLVWNEVVRANINSEHTKPPQSLLGQLMFREMFYLLSRSVENWDDDVNNSNCKRIEWGSYDEVLMTAWESGMTGYPYIDAMMRQLDTTGWMHHLGRHAVSCFLTRGQLWQNWKHGRDVFDRKLIDSDWALNNGNWLWLAGVAPFSMPYYRVYNPCPDAKSSLNVETRDASFIRHWVPELSRFPSRYIFEPHLAPIEIQRSSKCIIGKDYPEPIVDRKEARKRNISLFKKSLENLS
jgi:cryptochrome